MAKNVAKESKKNEKCKCSSEAENKNGIDSHVDGCVCQSKEKDVDLTKEIESLKDQLDKKSKACDDNFNLAQRIAAEFDNFKKRTVREKEGLYSDAVADAVKVFLPVADNFERAMQSIRSSEGDNSIKEGVELVFKQFKDVFQSLKVEEIKALGEKFNPELHNAVMHIEDDSYGENEIIEQLQKGYMMKDKVIRHSMVKVAN